MSDSYIFYVHGISCASCSGSIEQCLQDKYNKQLKDFNVDFTCEPKKIIIRLVEQSINSKYQQIWQQLKTDIEDSGFNCEEYNYLPTTAIQAKSLIDPNNPQLPQRIYTRLKKISSSPWFLGIIGCSTGLALLITMLIIGHLPLVAMISVACVSVVLTLALGANSYYEAWKKMKTMGSVTMDTLFTISTLTVIGVSIAAFFIPWLPMMFEAGLLIYGFRYIGIGIENSIKEKIGTAKFQDRAPKMVRLLSDKHSTKTPLLQIKPQDIILIKPGELIPLDGICQEACSIYDTIITGAIVPHYIKANTLVLAGMKLAKDAQPIRVVVTKPVQASYLARLDAGIAQSIQGRAPLEITTGKILTYFVPTVIILALVSGLTMGVFFPIGLAIKCAISVLVAACPCTLGLIIPLSVRTGIHKAAEHGVRFKNSKILQQAEQIDTVVLDLNGTLTVGVPTVSHFFFIPNNGNEKVWVEQILNICKALESQAMHPIGKAIYAYSTKKAALSLTASQLDTSHHAGITGTINKVGYALGSASLMQKQGIDTACVEQKLSLKAGDSLVFIARQNKLIGYFIITDPLRKDAKRAVQALQKMGKEVHICTGADEKTALRLAKAVGIKHLKAACVGTSIKKGDNSKVDYIKSLKKQGRKVAMVGDAANDTQAIAESDFGIAMLSQEGDEITQQQAGAIIQNGSLLTIVSAFKISQQTVSIIKQNLLISFAYNLGSLVLTGGLLTALGVTFPPALGVVFMAVQACSVLLNVYRFKQQTLDHLQEPSALRVKPLEESHLKVIKSPQIANNAKKIQQFNENSKIQANKKLPILIPSLKYKNLSALLANSYFNSSPVNSNLDNKKINHAVKDKTTKMNYF